MKGGPRGAATAVAPSSTKTAREVARGGGGGGVNPFQSVLNKPKATEAAIASAAGGGGDGGNKGKTTLWAPVHLNDALTHVFAVAHECTNRWRHFHDMRAGAQGQRSLYHKHPPMPCTARLPCYMHADCFSRERRGEHEARGPARRGSSEAAAAKGKQIPRSLLFHTESNKKVFRKVHLWPLGTAAR